VTRAALALALVLALSSQSTKEVPVAVYAPGTASCETWLSARAAHLKRTPGDHRFMQFESFVAGYASAYNVFASAPAVGGARNILNTTTADEHWGIIDAFCKDNPKQPFHQGVLALVNELTARSAK
jgi:hypothetical protein